MVEYTSKVNVPKGPQKMKALLLNSSNIRKFFKLKGKAGLF